MGMAAGQARLLSITSRMSDNELRAQIINNNKMRLATQSSQVSEAYTAALNDAQMMFSNYDKENNATYQQLTFNALTSYNPYNNQYAISNASGQVLVSEKDATNFQDANGDLNTFLSYYGLEYTTTYFENLNEYANADGTIPYATGETDADGNMITASSGMTAEQLQAYYEGIEGSTLHPGYEATIAGVDYYNYTTAMTEFDEAYTAWCGSIATNMENYLQTLDPGTGTLTAIEGSISGATDVAAMTTVLNNLENYINNGYKNLCTSSATSNNYITQMLEQISAAKSGETVYKNGDGSSALTYDSASKTLTFGASSNGTINPGDEVFQIIQGPNGADGKPTYSLKTYDKDGAFVDTTPISINTSGSTISFSYNYVDEDGSSTTVEFKDIPNVFNGASASSFTIKEVQPLDVDTMQQTAKEIIKSLKNSIYNVWDPTKNEFKAAASDPSIYNAFTTKGAALSQLLLGRDVGEANYPNLLDTSWVLGQMTTQQQESFQPILDVLTLDSIMNTYGEPKYAWIDKSEVTDSYNENGDAKAQWYTNLFNRMQSGGYQVLQDGLASSSEWIKFAFESGLVTLEQVDTDNNWNTIMYSNCSDITEQTNNAAITIAEAEYNAAMNKIENKDKMYDLELKNIDTEHNSLQTEYDSIKTAIDKNIERTFKIYS